jgi:hypothetical protein
MKNRELFQRDPSAARLVNDGVAAVTEATTPKEIETLRYELEHFVCEGQYKEGLVRIIESYLGSISAPLQPAAWVSGFYGSGKSHLLKMLRHLWVDTTFPSDGVTARGLAHLPHDVKALFKELDTLGKRCGGLVAVSDKLPGGGGISLRKAILGIIFQSRGLPAEIAQAEFCLWLQKNNILDAVKAHVEKCGKDFVGELAELYASPLLADAVLKADPTFAADLKSARSVLRTQFRDRSDVTTDEFLRLLRAVLSTDRQIPCTLIALDELQLFIGESAQSSYDVQLVVESLCKQMDSRVLIVGSGQTALAGNIPMLQRLRDRFTINVELSDSDVETVTRRVVLAKKADKRKVIEDMFQAHAGEVDRQLAGTRIGPRAEDRKFMVEDYPLLPVRRRFWERVLRTVDLPGTASQLRTQLRVVHDSVRMLADKPVGTVLGADFIFEELQPDLLRTNFLLREIDQTIRNLDDGTDDGKLARRVCGLIFLIRKLPRGEGFVDTGVRAIPEMLADLLVADLANDGAALRCDIPRVLDKLVADGVLIKLDEEYSLQTRESSDWDREFRNRHSRLNGDLSAINNKRSTLLSAQCSTVLGELRLTQGASRTARAFRVHYSNDAPQVEGQEIPVWIRDGWGENEGTVLSDARAAGSDSATIFAYIPKGSAEDLKKAILEYEAAKATLDFKGTPTTPEGIEARDAMSTRMKTAENTRDRIIRDVINAAKVLKGGGSEIIAIDLVEKVRSAAEDSLDRLFPRFKDGDDHRWSSVINRAKNNDANALQALDWKDSPEKHPVCAAILAEVGAGRRGKEIRDKFEASPYGWPRDAIDGALMTLHATGHLRAVHKGAVLVVGQLDQAKVSVTDFRAETATIDAKGRIKLRKLFQVADVPCKPNEEATAAGAFLTRMYDLADGAGGDAPLPARPSTLHLDTLRGLAGNEQLAAILGAYAELENNLKDWKALADLASKRVPAWDTLCGFLRHAGGLVGSVDLQKEADAIVDERRLLDVADPAPEIHHALVKALRAAVKVAHGEFETVFNREMDSLTANANWKQLNKAQQQGILGDCGLSGVPVLAIGDDVALQRALTETALGAWRTKAEALPQQFRNAAVAAAKLLEPKTQSVRLTSGTLKTPDDVKAWLAEIEKDLKAKLKNGPIVIG